MPSQRLRHSCFVILSSLGLSPFVIPLQFATAADESATIPVGVARVDITPDYPVRLNGFASRKTESTGIRQHIWAKALTFGGFYDDGPAVLIAVDTLGIPDKLHESVAAKLAAHGVKRERLAITATHTHTAPMVNNVSPTLFGMAIPPEHQARIDRYSDILAEQLVSVALAALKNRQPSRLAWGVGKVGVAMNRRTKGGPVDHDLPLLTVRGLDRRLRAIWVSYACHCVTLSDFKISGDWAGYAQEIIERNHPACMALVSIGCGADANPNSGVTGDKADIAEKQGLEIATEVERLLASPLTAIAGPVVVKHERIDLPLADLPPRAQWEEKARRTDATGYHARVQLARLDRGESLLTQITYPIQSWTFGDRLAMLFLPGEVVVDYSLRLKRELDGRRLWINAYANHCPGYVPSERILKEGGYEGGGAMTYYDIPGPYAAGLEQKIVDVVKRQLGEVIPTVADASRTQGIPPRTPSQALTTFRTKPNLAVELVAAEPLVTSPVAIAFGTDGRLWVCEMFDYPSGVPEDGGSRIEDGKAQKAGDPPFSILHPQRKPGGRVKVLRDTNDDGRYDEATVFLDGIPFPTGVTVWRDGVLVCAAPDILFARDTDGDGKADEIKKLFSGFGTDNYQARVNSLEYGLDGWVYGSCGLFGGEIKSFNGTVLKLGDRDFRIRPDTGEIEPATGRTQQGRVRNDWGDWFGCDNSNLVWHYPLADHYVRRNPHYAPPAPAVNVLAGTDGRQLFPISNQVLFKLSGPPGAVTAACGLGIYRDDYLGAEFTGNAFICEPVNNLVTRGILDPRGSTFVGRRAEDEQQSEFLASTDPWFRPVQARTGPDGALWIVDMYRFVIEHPRWIPPEVVSTLDVRAGAGMGRIYRVVRKDAPPRKPVPLDQHVFEQLIEAIDTPNGVQRDLAAQRVRWHEGPWYKNPRLARMVDAAIRASSRPAARLQLLEIRAEFPQFSDSDEWVGWMGRALRDSSAGVRRFAVEHAAGWKSKPADIRAGLLRTLDDTDGQVRLQLAYSLWQWDDPKSAAVLAKLLLGATRQADDDQRMPLDRYLIAAVMSSLRPDNVDAVLQAVLEARPETPEKIETIGLLLSQAVAFGVDGAVHRGLGAIAKFGPSPVSTSQLRALSNVFDVLGLRSSERERLLDDATRKQLSTVLDIARDIAGRGGDNTDRRLAAVRLLGRWPTAREADLVALGILLTPQSPAELQLAAVDSLGQVDDATVPGRLLEGWETHSPQVRSRVLDVLLSRGTWTVALLDAVEQQRVRPADFDLTRRDRLAQHKQAAVRDRAARLLNVATSPDRQKLVNDYAAAATQSGDAVRGRAVFTKHCAACHKLDGTGNAVGPDIAVYASKPLQAMVIAVLDPNQAVESRYVSYVAARQDGRVATGIIKNETATSLSLAAADGKVETLLRTEIEELRSTGKSLMPDGFERDIPPVALADLIAFVIQFGSPPKSLPGNKPDVVRAAANGVIELPASKAELRGRDITFETEFQNVGYWHGADDRATWSVETSTAATFDVYVEWACDGDSAGNLFVIEAGSASLTGNVPTTGAWSRYRQQRFGSLTLPAGSHRVSMHPAGSVRGALLDLHAIRLVASKAPAPMPRLAKVDPNEESASVEPATIAKQILDESRPAAERDKLARSQAMRAAEVVRDLVRDLKPGTPEEYRRIPWIWRVSIATGQENEVGPVRRLLDAAVPQADQPLHDWQAVVIGGGIINGISQAGAWPRKRIAELLVDDRELTSRWKRTIDLASTMADDEKISTGTRYDALRILGADTWESRGRQLVRYLAEGTHAELQMGAVSAVCDVESPAVIEPLLSGLKHFTPTNRKLAIDGMLRTSGRQAALRKTIDDGHVKPEWLTDDQRKRLESGK
jgi:putative membrane-bound dehydrogenase-like protein